MKREPHVRIDDHDTDVAIWLEPCEGDEAIGLCIGLGDTLTEALTDAFIALRSARDQVLDLMPQDARALLQEPAEP